MLRHYGRQSRPQPAAQLVACIATVHLLAMSSALFARAAPHPSLGRRQTLVARDGGGAKTVEIVVPIVVVVVLIAGVGATIMFRKGIFSKFGGLISSVSNTLAPPRRQPVATGDVRELTAETLAGPAATAAARPGRTRRNRRTPSQISTRSLPVYMKEPGEHELVIIQGSQDLEDAPLESQTIVMPSVPESDTESTTHSRNISQTSSNVYVVVHNNARVDTPLLGHHESHDNDTSSSEIPTPDLSNDNSPELQQSGARPSQDAGDSRAALLQDASPGPDARGEAPPYFEVIPSDTLMHSSNDLSRIQTGRSEMESPISLSTMPSRNIESPGPEDPAAAGPDTHHRSVFRGLFHAAQHVLTPHGQRSAQSPPPGAGYAIRPSMDSVTSLNSEGPARATSPLGPGHRPSTSGSASGFSLTSTPFRTRTRSTSNFHAGHLTSPSLLSVNSISAPLTHTLVRTDFVYPKSGPTAEQLKFISSREAVGKFGVPYGRDARAYAASSSRVDLSSPLPDYAEHVEHRSSIDGLPVAGPSGLGGHSRTPSSLDQVARNEQDGAADGERASEPVVAASAQLPPPDGEPPHDADAQESHAEPPPPPSADDDKKAAEDTKPDAPVEESSHSSSPAAPANDAGPKPVLTSDSSSSDIPPPGLPTDADVPRSTVSQAPTAFRMPPGAPRSESRASSLSYATAESSFSDPPASPALHIPLPEDASPSTSGPPTPRAEHPADELAA